ncbi:MAG: DUF438 domain-containing protein, partial [Spirochaetes bacterium]|nr:DUF438 domain-containing protein [Spirochaetota bacterium]
VGTLTSTEVTTIEQSLIDEGVSPDEIKRFCNVHALLFESSLEQAVATEDSPSHPLSLLRAENRAIEGIVAELRSALVEGSGMPDSVRVVLAKLKGVDRHYALKENAVFPFLEKHGFTGPSQVMWGKHNDVRQLLRDAEKAAASGTPAIEAARKDVFEPLAAEVEGMIFKEENILFPACAEKLEPAEWVKVLDSFREIGLPYAKPPAADASLAELSALKAEAVESGVVSLPSGRVSPVELAALLDVLPVDISFVDASDTVRYFNQTKERIFPRAVSVIGRNVRNCHPPQSVGKVVEILDSFRRGERDHADFWIDLHGRFVSIRYFAVRDAFGKYLGCLEVSQDLTGPRSLTGEHRLLDDGRPVGA